MLGMECERVEEALDEEREGEVVGVAFEREEAGVGVEEPAEREVEVEEVDGVAAAADLDGVDDAAAVVFVLSFDRAVSVFFLFLPESRLLASGWAARALEA